jgi:hypothetical protein
MECQMRFSNISLILVDNLFVMDQFIDGQLNVMFFESNRYQIETELNWKVSATSWSKIESKPIWFDSPAVQVVSA